MSISIRINLEYNTPMSVIKAVSVSCNYNFGNASLEYIVFKKLLESSVLYDTGVRIFSNQS